MSGIKACIYSEYTIFCDGRPYGINKQEKDCRFCKEFLGREILHCKDCGEQSILSEEGYCPLCGKYVDNTK